MKDKTLITIISVYIIRKIEGQSLYIYINSQILNKYLLLLNK